ncbi:MAG: hypothetical protein QOD03_1713 [Verrucomicrobiota bacterium]
MILAFATEKIPTASLFPPSSIRQPFRVIVAAGKQRKDKSSPQFAEVHFFEEARAVAIILCGQIIDGAIFAQLRLQRGINFCAAEIVNAVV